MGRFSRLAKAGGDQLVASRPDRNPAATTPRCSPPTLLDHRAAPAASQRSVLQRLDMAFKSFFERGETPDFRHFKCCDRGLRSFNVPDPAIRDGSCWLKGIGRFRQPSAGREDIAAEGRKDAAPGRGPARSPWKRMPKPEGRPKPWEWTWASGTAPLSRRATWCLPSALTGGGSSGRNAPCRGRRRDWRPAGRRWARFGAHGSGRGYGSATARSANEYGRQWSGRL